MGFRIGDYVIVNYGIDEYIGQIKSFSKGKMEVEICTNRKKSEPNEVELVMVDEKQIRPVSLENLKRKRRRKAILV